MRNTLICTVGTSLFGNINWLSKDEPDHPICQAHAAKNWHQLAVELLKEEPTARRCGAEINSITSIVTNDNLDAQIRLIFLVSDTDDAGNIGKVLSHYYRAAENPIQFKVVENPKRLEGLNDASLDRFQRDGLKNLVIQISEEVRKYTPDAIAINATGGYKAQISFAGMIGQALSIPVYYLFERFTKVIELPPQPVSLDLTLWLNYYSLFDQIVAAEALKTSQIQIDYDELTLSAMIEKEIIDNVEYIALTAMGQLFHERCRLQFRQQEKTLLSLIPQDETSLEKKTINLRDDHGKDELKAFSKKLCRSPYVKSIINSLPFNPKLAKPIRRVTDDGLIDFVLSWTEPGYGICIQSTGRNRVETNTIALHLEAEFME